MISLIFRGFIICICATPACYHKQTAEHWLSQVDKMFRSVLDVKHDWMKRHSSKDDGYTGIVFDNGKLHVLLWKRVPIRDDVNTLLTIIRYTRLDDLQSMMAETMTQGAGSPSLRTKDLKSISSCHWVDFTM